MKQTKKTTLLYILVITLIHATLLPKTTYWKWQNINTHAVKFPASFEWGLTTLAYETDGYAKSSTWYAWENHTGNNTSTPFTKTRSGNAAAHTQNYQEDVQLMKEMGITTYCFSLDWSRIEPEQGYFDEAMLQYYGDLCDELKKKQYRCHRNS